MGIFENSFLAVYCRPNEKFASAHPGLSVWEKDFRVQNIPEDDLIWAVNPVELQK